MIHSDASIESWEIVFEYENETALENLKRQEQLSDCQAMKSESGAALPFGNGLSSD